MPKSLGALKRALIASAATVALVSLSACSSEEGGTAASGTDKPVVITTFTVLQDIAANVGGDQIIVESLTKPGAEIHGYEPTPGDLRRAQNTQLIIDNGLGLEAWFEKFTKQLDVPRVTASEGVEVINIEEDAYAGQANPHAWMSPLIVQQYVDNIAAAFSELKPESAEYFAANAAAYKTELQKVNDELVTALSALPENQRALVSCEGAFSYFARDAGLNEQYIWPVNAEQQATPQRIAATIDFVNAQQPNAVFCETTVNDAPMQQVVEASGVNFGGMLYVDSLSGPDGPVPSYLDLIRYNTELVRSGLLGE